VNERFACWVIVSGSTTTGFRSREREDLLPTLKRLQRTDPDAVLKWFARGRLWESPLDATRAMREQKSATRSRGRDWRPGGSHADPRARYELSRDEKRARFKKRLVRDRSEGRKPKSGKR
jgi:hypothetical protein